MPLSAISIAVGDIPAFGTLIQSVILSVAGGAPGWMKEWLLRVAVAEWTLWMVFALTRSFRLCIIPTRRISRALQSCDVSRT
jgi:hypothetical protein